MYHRSHYTSPLAAGNTIVAMAGYHGPALAVRAYGAGEVTASHRLWYHAQRNPQRMGSGEVVDDHIYIYNENGVVFCLELASGE